jgi:hypothetical protein
MAADALFPMERCMTAKFCGGAVFLSLLKGFSVARAIFSAWLTVSAGISDMPSHKHCTLCIVHSRHSTIDAAGWAGVIVSV